MIGSVFLGRYETMRLLGQGGMGRVYLARDRQQDEPVVVKVMHDYIAANPVFRERFQREIAFMGSFEHPHAVKFFDASLDDPQGPCIVMEYLPGIGLDRLLAKNTRINPARLHRFVRQLCDVLQAAHAQGIVHRDLKPANLMILDPDTPREYLKVMDFGLAQMAEQKKSGPTEYAVGTPGYMPPEQVRGEVVDHRGDLYSVGAILYQLLTGRLPFPGTTVMEILMAQVEGPPPTFASIGLGDTIPPAVEKVVRTALEMNPDDRFQSAQELFEAYEAAVLQGYQAAPDVASAGPDDPGPGPPPPPETESDDEWPADPNATVDRVEAYMPEQLAAVKLQAFLDEVGGTVVENLPGLIRVHLKMNSQVLQSPSRGGLLSWLGFGPKYALLAMELHIKKKDTKDQKNVLQVTARIYPAQGGPVPDNSEWTAHCELIFDTLRSYLMSKK